jgi:hypothetical protein
MKKILFTFIISLSLISCNSTYKLNGLYVTDYSFGIENLNSEPDFDLIINLINSNYFESSVVYLDFKTKLNGIRHFKCVDSNYSVPFKYIKLDKYTIEIKYNFNSIFNTSNLDDDLLFLNIGKTILKYDKTLHEWYYVFKLDNNTNVIYSLRKIKK